MRIVIVGAGGHAQVVADIFFQHRKLGDSFQPIGYVDDNQGLKGSSFLGLPVLGKLDWLTKNRDQFDQVIIAIGSNKIRMQVAELLESLLISFATAIHPSAIIGSAVEIGSGSIVCANVVINPGTYIGKHAIINTAATVDHHSHVQEFAHLAPGTHTGGEVSIGRGAFLGVGALVLPRQKIGQWATIGAGALVNVNVPDDEVVVGVPARPIKR